MPIILEIGYQKFLIKKDSDAFAAMKALTGAVQLDSRHKKIDGTYKEYFWPKSEQRAISVTTAMPDQILRNEPVDFDIEDTGPKQLGMGGAK